MLDAIVCGGFRRPAPSFVAKEVGAVAAVVAVVVAAIVIVVVVAHRLKELLSEIPTSPAPPGATDTIRRTLGMIHANMTIQNMAAVKITQLDMKYMFSCSPSCVKAKRRDTSSLKQLAPRVAATT